MEKKNYVHPVTKSLSLEVRVCEPPMICSEPPVYAAPDPIPVDDDDLF